jgi:hypothetical protein
MAGKAIGVQAERFKRAILAKSYCAYCRLRDVGCPQFFIVEFVFFGIVGRAWIHVINKVIVLRVERRNCLVSFDKGGKSLLIAADEVETHSGILRSLTGKNYTDRCFLFASGIIHAIWQIKRTVFLGQITGNIGNDLFNIVNCFDYESQSTIIVGIKVAA